MGRGITGKLAVGEIELRLVLDQRKFHLIHQDCIVCGGIGLQISLRIESTIIHVYLRLHFGNADHDAQTQGADAGGSHLGGSVGIDGNIPMLFCIQRGVIGITRSDGFHIREINIHLRFRRHLGHRRDGSVLFEFILEEAESFPKGSLQLCISQLGTTRIVC